MMNFDDVNRTSMIHAKCLIHQTNKYYECEAMSSHMIPSLLKQYHQFKICACVCGCFERSLTLFMLVDNLCENIMHLVLELFYFLIQLW